MKFRKLILLVIVLGSVIATIFLSIVTVSSIKSSGEKGYSVFIFLYPIIIIITLFAMIISILTKKSESQFYKLLLFIQVVYYIVFIIIISSI